MNDIDFLPEHYHLAEARRTRIVREIVLLADRRPLHRRLVRQCTKANRRSGAPGRRPSRPSHGRPEPDHPSHPVREPEARYPAANALAARADRTHQRLAGGRGPGPVDAPFVGGDQLGASWIRGPLPRPQGHRAGGGGGGGGGGGDVEPGLAPTDMEIADFVGRLSSYPLFTNVKMDYSRAVQVKELKAREFHVQFEVPLDRDYKLVHGAGEVARAD